MATVLSSNQEYVERAIYKAIRTVVEEHGYIPDITSFPNTATGASNYKAAVKAIADGVKKFAIEVFGPSNVQSVGNLEVPRIVIKPRRVIEGGIGASVGKSFSDNGDGTFKSYVVQGTSSNIHIEVKLVSNSAAQHRILHAILSASMNSRGYKKTITNQDFFYKYVGYEDSEDLQTGITINTYTYQVEDIDMINEDVIDPAVAKISQIDMEIYTGTYFPTTTHDPLDYAEGDTLTVIPEP